MDRTLLFYHTATTQPVKRLCSRRLFSFPQKEQLRRISTFDSYDRMIEFGQKHLNDQFVLDGIQRVSARNAILREIVSNSLAHRDYSSGYIPKMVIERDRILVENGNRAHGIGALNINAFKPYPKNPASLSFPSVMIR